MQQKVPILPSNCTPLMRQKIIYEVFMEGKSINEGAAD